MAKKKDLSVLISDINKTYGDGSVMLANSNIQPIECVSTGIPNLDLIVGGKGFPRSKITEVYGAESVGKSSLTLKAIAEAQKTGETAFIDVEQAFNFDWAAKLGVDLGRLIICQPSYAEEALDIFIKLAESNAFSLIVLDSVAALSPKCETEGEVGDTSVGALARLMGRSLRMLAPILKQKSPQTAAVFINQIRANIGFFVKDKDTTPGGKALRSFASCRIQLWRKEILKKGDSAIGIRVGVKNKKNKVVTPYRECTFDILF